jgi:hypothetical protein
MSCSCGSTDDVRARGAVQEALDHIGLGQAAARIDEMRASFSSADRWERKAERAAQAGLDDAIVALWRSQAQLDRRQALRRGRAAVAILDERLAREDWADTVRSLGREFAEHDGQGALDDARERITLLLVEQDVVPAERVRPILASLASRFSRPPDGGLNETVVNLRTVVVAQLQKQDGGNPDDPGPTSPGGGYTNDCLAIATGVCEAAMIVCACIPSCWCCLWLIIVLAYLIAVCACAGRFDCVRINVPPELGG